MRTQILVLAIALIVTGPSSVMAADEFATPPAWQVGDLWHYTAHLPNQPDFIYYDLTWKVVRPGVVASLETEGGHDQLNFYSESLEWLGVDGATYDMLRHGAKRYDPISKFEPPIPLYAWPLTVGKKWERCSTNTVPPGGRHCNSFEVLRFEDVSTKAGRFRAAVIEHRLDGKLLSRRWYAPKAKNIVRNEQFVPYQNERLRLTLEIDRLELSPSLAFLDQAMALICAETGREYDAHQVRCVAPGEQEVD